MIQKYNSILNFEELFRSVGTAYIVFDVTDPEFIIIDENQAHAEMVMAERTGVKGKPLLEALNDISKEYVFQYKDQLEKSISKVVATGEPDVVHDMRCDITDKQGVVTTKFWEVTHYPIFERDKVKAICQQTHDITKSVLSRRELSLANDQLEQALAYSEVGTWMWNLDTDVIMADKNLARMFGLNGGIAQVEVPIENLMKSVHSDDIAYVRRAIAKAIAEKSTSYESEYRTSDTEGNMRWLLARGHVEVNELGQEVRFPGLVVDITKRKITENNLHILAKTNTQFSAEIGYRQTLDSIASMIVPDVADWCSIDILEDGKIEQVSIAHSDPAKVKWAKQLRAKQGPVNTDAPTGSAFVIRTGEVEYAPYITDEMLQAAATSEKELKLLRNLDFQSAIIAPLKIDGKTIGAISFISTSHRHYDENDVEVAQALANRAALAVYNANLFQAAKSEIKERKKLQSELEALNSALEGRVKQRTVQLEKTNQNMQAEIIQRQKIENERVQHYIDLNKTKDEFISLASHQLRTPATGVKQYLGMVLEGMAGDMTHSQQALLQKAYESNERQLTIISDLLKVAQLDAGKVQLHRSEVNLAELLMDVIKEQEDTYLKREQTLQFVVPPFTPIVFADPGKMRMVFENIIDNASKYSEAGKSIKVMLTEQDDTIVVAIQDEGVGVATEDLPKLFEKFNRVHNHLSNHVGGTGLGLYWAKKIVDLHGGVIEVTSVLAKSSTFSIYLPKSETIALKTVSNGGAYE